MGAAPLVAELAAACPDLVVLATSRAPLRIRAEHELSLAPLPLPEADSVASASDSPAVALFLDRARATGAALTLDEESAATIAAICRRLDGLPLALELAAARARLLTPEVLLARLDQHAPGGGLRDLPDRQRTMTATLDWSHDLLEPEEQDLLARLAVFAGSFALDAIEPVSGSGRRPRGARGARRPVAGHAGAPGRGAATVPAARTGPAVRRGTTAGVRTGTRRRGPACGALPRARGAGTSRARRRIPGGHARRARGRPRQPALGVPAAAGDRPGRRGGGAGVERLALPGPARSRPRGDLLAGAARARHPGGAGTRQRAGGRGRPALRDRGHPTDARGRRRGHGQRTSPTGRVPPRPRSSPAPLPCSPATCCPRSGRSRKVLRAPRRPVPPGPSPMRSSRAAS